MATDTGEQLIPLVDLELGHQSLMIELRAAFERVVASSSFVDGAEVERLEAMLAAQVSVAHAVAVGSGTAALHLALAAAGIGPGDEVILPPNTFFATAEAVFATGATPVLADVDVRTALLDPDAAEAAVTGRTAAIVAVHLYGQPIDADRFSALAERKGLLLLEDSAQAMGAAWRGRPTGSMGAAAAFSFYPGKNLGALGDGGAVTTSDGDLARRVRLLRSHGEESKGVHVLTGYCERLDELQAAFLTAKLPSFPAAQAARSHAATRYHENLATVEDVQLLETDEGAQHAHHLVVVRVPERDSVLAAMRACGVGASVHYPTPIHLQPACPHLGKTGMFPSAEALSETVLSLPIYPGMADAVVDRCSDALALAVGQLR